MSANATARSKSSTRPVIGERPGASCRLRRTARGASVRTVFQGGESGVNSQPSFNQRLRTLTVHGSGFERDRLEQKGRQMATVGLATWLLQDRLVDAAGLLRLMPRLSATVRTARPLGVGRPRSIHRPAFAHLGGRGVHPGDALADKALNRADRFAVNGRDDGYRGAASAEIGRAHV